MNALETALYSALSDDSALTTKLGGSYIYNLAAPQGQVVPYVIFAKAGGGDENLTPHRMRNYVYLLKGVSDGLKEAGEILDLIDTVLEGTTLSVTGWTNFYCYRETDVSYTEVMRDGTLRFHNGAYYRIRITKD